MILYIIFDLCFALFLAGETTKTNPVLGKYDEIAHSLAFKIHHFVSGIGTMIFFVISMLGSMIFFVTYN